MLKSLFTVLALTTIGTAHEAAAACRSQDFGTVDAPEVTIRIQGMAYTPQCLRVRGGTKVTILASGGHPLQGVPNETGPANPFVGAQAFTTSQTRQLSERGTYDYFCTRHQSMGMVGTILVEE